MVEQGLVLVEVVEEEDYVIAKASSMERYAFFFLPAVRRQRAQKMKICLKIVKENVFPSSKFPLLPYFH